MTDRLRRAFLRPRAVRADSGFKVEVLGMTRVRYSYGERTATVPAEPILIDEGQFKGKRGWAVAVSLLTKWDDGESFSDEERELIQSRTKQALIFMGVPHLVG